MSKEIKYADLIYNEKMNGIFEKVCVKTKTAGYVAVSYTHLVAEATLVFYWLGYLDSNQGNARFRVWCLTAWLYPNLSAATTLFYLFSMLLSIAYFKKFIFFQKTVPIHRFIV